MNADTTREVENIKARGYWKKGESLGAGGWGKVYSFASTWNEYALYNLDEDTTEIVCTITARDDSTAIKAFSELFRIGEFAHEVYRHETKSTLILEQL